MDHRTADPKGRRSLSKRLAIQSRELVIWNLAGQATQPDSTRFRASQTGDDTLADSRLLKFRKGSQDVELQLARGRRTVNSFPEAHERDAERLKFLDECDQVAEVATKAIEPPGDHDIKTALPGVSDERVEGRSALLRA
jgi:hypothetical protein